MSGNLIAFYKSPWKRAGIQEQALRSASERRCAPETKELDCLYPCLGLHGKSEFMTEYMELCNFKSIHLGYTGRKTQLSLEEVAFFFLVLQM